MDVRALKALEVMKSYHDCDLTLSAELLSVIREHYSIPSEYILHASALGQCPYDSLPSGFSISIDALEARLRFLPSPCDRGVSHMVNLNLVHVREEMCSAQPGVDGKDYHVVRMINLPEHDPNAPLEMHLSPLTHGTWIWQDETASVKYAWGL
ncbi:hypothetical protein BHE74_00015971 [Ensete ventricosum]|nr:hypothetical protein BHE74_00015971 [Ensete ventricosum]RZR97412.1 hypothetical protein BHM03_00026594 [Ensete ventricosum]